jgi:hypothetical protein
VREVSVNVTVRSPTAKEVGFAGGGALDATIGLGCGRCVFACVLAWRPPPPRFNATISATAATSADNSDTTIARRRVVAAGVGLREAARSRAAAVSRGVRCRLGGVDCTDKAGDG